MGKDPDYIRRWLINAGGASMLAEALPDAAAQAVPEAGRTGEAARAAEATQVAEGAQTAGGMQPAAGAPAAISPITTALAAYVADTLDRELPMAVVARTKMHIIDTIAAIVSGSRLKPGQFAARYVDSLGGKPQATVFGTRIVTSTVNAAFANGMAGHADETDDTNPVGPFHAGCGVVSAAWAMAELKGRSGNDVLRAITLGYDVGARLIVALGGTRHNPSCLTNTFAATATCAALLRLDSRQVRHAFSYAGQQASGIGYWDRDLEHIEKAFDFGAMGARNAVTAATMVAMGSTAVDDPFSGSPNILSVLGQKPAPEALIAELGGRYEVFNTTIKKWTVGLPLQSVLDSMAVLLQDRAVRVDNIKHVAVEVASGDVHIVDNNPIPDLCLQHLVALTIVDDGATFTNVHDASRMHDPRVLAIRKRVELVPSDELQAATPAHQTIVRIETLDGRNLVQRTSLVRGTARNPMDVTEVQSKARELMTPVLGAGRANEVIATVDGFEHVGPVVKLRRLLQA
jgi:2-methylcitrate dehydratase PrpD